MIETASHPQLARPQVVAGDARTALCRFREVKREQRAFGIKGRTA
jgi:hypothetical protein